MGRQVGSRQIVIRSGVKDRSQFRRGLAMIHWAESRADDLFSGGRRRMVFAETQTLCGVLRNTDCISPVAIFLKNRAWRKL
jgi:hypothetical protein